MAKKSSENILRIFTTILFSGVIAAFLIYLIGESPLVVVQELFNGACGSKLRFGTTLAEMTPLLLTSTAFAIAAKSGVFNIGVEGSVFLGALASAYVGINWTFLPDYLLVFACFLVGAIVGGAWALIPAYLKVKYDVNEVTVAILLNTVAVYITSYFVSGPMSSGGAVAQTHPVTVHLSKFMAPSNANVGFFIALAIVVIAYFVLNKSEFGFKVTSTGLNKQNAEYVGFRPNKVILQAMFISGAIGGIAGCIEILGVHGSFVENFAKGLGTQGMLISLISNNNLLVIPFVSLFIAVLNSGGMGIQVTTNVPKSLIDTVIAIIIVFATMSDLGVYVKRFLIKLFGKKESEIKGDSV